MQEQRTRWICTIHSRHSWKSMRTVCELGCDGSDTDVLTSAAHCDAAECVSRRSRRRRA
jgi:hypothetical protein